VDCQDVYFTHEGLRIHGYLYSSGGPVGKPAALLLHGYTPDTLELSALAQKLAEFGWACLLLEARGRGSSEGDAEDTNGYARDALVAVKYMRILGVDRKRNVRGGPEPRQRRGGTVRGAGRGSGGSGGASPVRRGRPRRAWQG